MAKEQELEFRTDFSELKITGVLNYDIYNGMSREKLTKFVKHDAERTARKFVSAEWTDEVEIRSEYIVIDSHYNVLVRVMAHLIYEHLKGATVVSLVSRNK